MAAFKEKYGHCNPKKSTSKLGSWASRQKRLYVKMKEGLDTTMRDERVAKLESIGFAFVVSL